MFSYIISYILRAKEKLDKLTAQSQGQGQQGPHAQGHPSQGHHAHHQVQGQQASHDQLMPQASQSGQPLTLQQVVDQTIEQSVDNTITLHTAPGQAGDQPEVIVVATVPPPIGPPPTYEQHFERLGRDPPTTSSAPPSAFHCKDEFMDTGPGPSPK